MSWGGLLNWTCTHDKLGKGNNSKRLIITVNCSIHYCLNGSHKRVFCCSRCECCHLRRNCVTWFLIRLPCTKRQNLKIICRKYIRTHTIPKKRLVFRCMRQVLIQSRFVFAFKTLSCRRNKVVFMSKKDVNHFQKWCFCQYQTNYNTKNNNGVNLGSLFPMLHN